MRRCVQRALNTDPCRTDSCIRLTSTCMEHPPVSSPSSFEGRQAGQVALTAGPALHCHCSMPVPTHSVYTQHTEEHTSSRFPLASKISSWHARARISTQDTGAFTSIGLCSTVCGIRGGLCACYARRTCTSSTTHTCAGLCKADKLLHRAYLY